MLGALIRTFFKGVFVLLLLVAAFAVYALYRSGNLPYVQEAVEEAAIVGSVKAAFAIHRDLSLRTLSVEADGGRVVLHGSVGTDQEKSAAEDLAGSVDGVERVENEIEVDADLDRESSPGDSRSLGARIDDVALLAKIRTALRLDRETKSLDLDVQVRSGAVRVRGRVPSEQVLDKVRERVAMIGGVEKLDLELEVEGDEKGG